MPILSRVAPDLPEVFRVLTDRYGFVLKVEDEYRLSLRSPNCIIDITFERYGAGFSSFWSTHRTIRTATTIPS